MSGRPDVSVIVVTHNGRDQALATLESARRSTGKAITEWLVVDSGSSDGTPDAVCARWPDVHVLRRANVGFAAGNNVGIAHASGRYVLLLNPDVIVEDGTLEALIEALDRRPHAGAASVTQLGPDGTALCSTRRFPSPLRAAGEALFLHRIPLLRRLSEEERPTGPSEREVDWASGAFLALRADVIQKIGYLDERFFLYSEEADWCYRLRRAGWSVVHLPVMTVTHLQGGYARPDLAAQLSYSKLLFAEKHYPRGRSELIRAALLARHAVRALLFGPAGLVRSRFRQRARAELLAFAVLSGRVPPPFVTGDATQGRA